MQNRVQLMTISRRGGESVSEYTNRFRRLMRFAGPMAQDVAQMVHLYVAGLGPEYASMRVQDQDLDSVYVEAVSIEGRLMRYHTPGSAGAGSSRSRGQAGGY